MKDMYDKYVQDSALYCQNLFATAEKFFKANVLVEEPIANADLPSEDSIGEISAAFQESSAEARRAYQSLSQFVKSHNEFPEQEIIIHSNDQEKRIKKISELGESLSILTSTLIAGQDLQEQIWADPQYTRQFTEMAELICKAVLWQQSLAVETHQEI